MTLEEWKKKARRYDVSIGGKSIGQVTGATRAEAETNARGLSGWKSNKTVLFRDMGRLYGKDVWEIPNV